MTPAPKEIFGIGRMETWLNSLLRHIKALKPFETPDIRPEFTTTGVGFYLKQSAGGGGSASVNVKRFQVISAEDKYWRCQHLTNDGNLLSGSIYNVLRPPSTWPDDVASAPAGTSAESLSAASGTSRTLNVSVSVEGEAKTIEVTQFLVGGPVASTLAGQGGLIWAIGPGIQTGYNDADGNEITWIDINTNAAHWGFSPQVTLYCVENINKYGVSERSEAVDPT